MLMDGPPNIELKLGKRLPIFKLSPYYRLISLSSMKLVYLLLPNLLESILDIVAGIAKSSGIGISNSFSSSTSFKYYKFLREPLLAIGIP